MICIVLLVCVYLLFESLLCIVYSHREKRERQPLQRLKDRQDLAMMVSSLKFIY